MTHLATFTNFGGNRESSLGTKAHKIHNFDSTKSKGCHDVEKWLLSQNLVRYESRETILNSGDVIELGELAGRVGDYGELDDAGAMLQYSLDGSRDEHSYASFTGAQLDIGKWKESHRSDGHFSNIAQDSEDELEHEEIGAVVHSLLEYLTTKQRNALKRVYLENYDQEPRSIIASRMRLSEHSLRDRVNAAFSKIREIRTGLISPATSTCLTSKHIKQEHTYGRKKKSVKRKKYEKA